MVHDVFGLEEQIVFPEINYDAIKGVRGLQVTFVTSQKDRQASFRMLELLGLSAVSVEQWCLCAGRELLSAGQADPHGLPGIADHER
jgi:hypothetical protein